VFQEPLVDILDVSSKHVSQLMNDALGISAWNELVPDISNVNRHQVRPEIPHLFKCLWFKHGWLFNDPNEAILLSLISGTWKESVDMKV